MRFEPPYVPKARRNRNAPPNQTLGAGCRAEGGQDDLDWGIDSDRGSQRLEPPRPSIPFGVSFHQAACQRAQFVPCVEREAQSEVVPQSRSQ